MKVVINGGHCPGLDSGAIGDRVMEAEINREVMFLVGGYLREVGYEILEVQENDLAGIVKRNNDLAADLFVSIHCNASVNHAASGTEVHYADEAGKLLAACIQERVADRLSTVNRGIKKSENLYVLKHADCPAVLVEMAFISNREDEELLIQNKNDFAGAIARGVIDYVTIFAKIV